MRMPSKATSVAIDIDGAVFELQRSHAESLSRASRVRYRAREERVQSRDGEGRQGKSTASGRARFGCGS